MKQIYFSSDWHGFHKNLCKGVSEWDSGYRNFSSIEEMNSTLINNINNTVKEDDIIYFLGDFTFGGIDKIWEFRKQIKCKNIHLILGNHDHHIENDTKLPNCLYKSFKHNYEDIVDLENSSFKDAYVYPSCLFKSINYVKQIKVKGHSFFLSHYAHRVWNKSHHGNIHLYGHSHDTLDNTGIKWGKSMDVSVDSAYRIFNEYRPFSIDEIIEIMNKRNINFIDHHNSKTT